MVSLLLLKIGINGPLFCRNYSNSGCWNGTANVTAYSPPAINITEITDPGKGFIALEVIDYYF